MARLVFDVAAGIAILFAGAMVVGRHPVRSVLALVVSFFGLAVCFVMLSAPFIAAIQVIVYAGAILVLFLFVLMLLNVGREGPAPDRHRIQRVLSTLAILFFAAFLLSLLRAHGGVPASTGSGVAAGDIPSLARLLFSDFLLPFEALSVLLLAALAGSFVLARREGP